MLTSACKKSDSSAGQPSPHPSASASAAASATVTLNASQQQDLKALLGSLRGERFPMEAIRKPKHAPLFLYLADTSQKPDVVLAALQAMTISYTSVPKHQTRLQAGEDYARVVAARLASQNPKILDSASVEKTNQSSSPDSSRLSRELTAIDAPGMSPGLSVCGGDATPSAFAWALELSGSKGSP